MPVCQNVKERRESWVNKNQRLLSRFLPMAKT